MERIVRGAAQIAGCAVVISGIAGYCADRPAQQSTARLTAAVLSQQDLPSDFLPAEDQQVFRGVGGGDPDCRRLLDLADLRGLRDVPQTHAVFYRTEPGSTLAEHVVAPGRARVLGYLRQTRAFAAGCRQLTMTMSTGQHTGQQAGQHGGQRAGPILLRRQVLNLAPFPALAGGGYGIQYAGRASDRYAVHVDLVMVPLGDRLLIVVQPSLVDERRLSSADRTESIADMALRKLQTPSRAPASGVGGTTLDR